MDLLRARQPTAGTLACAQHRSVSQAYLHLIATCTFTLPDAIALESSTVRSGASVYHCWAFFSMLPASRPYNTKVYWFRCTALIWSYRTVVRCRRRKGSP